MSDRNLNPDLFLSESLWELGENAKRKELLIFQLQDEYADLQAVVKRLEEDLKFSQDQRQELHKKARERSHANNNRPS